jgi:hypothetical protein
MPEIGRGFGDTILIFTLLGGHIGVLKHEGSSFRSLLDGRVIDFQGELLQIRIRERNIVQPERLA